MAARPSDEKSTGRGSERVELLRLQSGRLDVVSSLLEHVEEWCADRGYTDPQMANGARGAYVVSALPPGATTPEESVSPQ